MRYLSWDIGIKNLSYCLLEYDKETKKGEIIKWEIINLLDDKKEIIYKCQKIMKNKKEEKICNKGASKYNKLDSKFYCNMHSKKIELKECIVINNRICQNEKCIKKITFTTENPMLGYCTVHGNKLIKDGIKLDKIVKKNKTLEKKNEMDTIAKKLVYELDKRKFLLDSDIVLIENQPALKNPKMKSIQMMIYSYFMIRGIIDNDKTDLMKIQFLLASNKLKIKFNQEIQESINQEINNKTKNKYKRHKDLAKKYCEYYLKENNENDIKIEKMKKVENTIWLDFFNSHKKKDDLADTFLMNIYFIKNC